MRRHQWKKHRNTMIRRIKEGKAKAQENPSFQDMVTALQEGPRAALKVYRSWTERQYRHMKQVMDALEPVLPLEINVAWKTIEAMHDDIVG